MSRSRRRSADIRAGRRPHVEVAGETAHARVAATAAYEVLLPQLERLRAVLAADRTLRRSIGDARCHHAEFDRLLAAAVGQAFAADALQAPTPIGVSSWVAEGLARSRERELALFAAADVLGVLQATTVPNPRWGSVDSSDPPLRPPHASSGLDRDG